jgi:hypothetical protein
MVKVSDRKDDLPPSGKQRMSIQIAKFELARSLTSEASSPAIGRLPGMLSPERPTAAARGIVTAVVIAVPFWALFAFTLYLLI